MNRPVNLSSPVRTPSRRALMKGAAWATPVAAISIAAPAMATSPPEPPISVTLDGDSCKYPGQSTDNKAFSYKLIFNITNNRDYPVEFRVTSLYVDPNSGTNIQFSAYTIPQTTWTALAPGQTVSLEFISDESTNSANGTAEIDFEVRKVGGAAEPPVQGSIPINGLPPCDKEDAATTATPSDTSQGAASEDAPVEEASSSEAIEKPAEVVEPTEEEKQPEEEEAPVEETTTETEDGNPPAVEQPTEDETAPVSDEGGAADSWIVQEEDSEKS